MRPDDLRLAPPRHVRIRGKGAKERICPLWTETAAALQRLIEANGAEGTVVFRSAVGHPLSRDGAAYLLSKYVDRAARQLPALRQQRISPQFSATAVPSHSCKPVSTSRSFVTTSDMPA